MAIRPLPIARPCSESFGAMKGDEKTRFCDSCGKDVHDLSARTEAEARTFLTEARGARLCIRYAKDAHGAIRFRAVTIAAALSLAACSVATEPAPGTSTHAPTTSAVPVAPDDAEGDHDMGDVIIDIDDRCPDEPGPNDDGCPE